MTVRGQQCCTFRFPLMLARTKAVEPIVELLVIGDAKTFM